MNANLFERLERSIADLTKTAITTPAGETVSYADLIALSGRLANVLAARASSPVTGWRSRSRSRCRPWSCIWPPVRAGAVYLPLNTAYTLAELEYFIGDCGALAGGLRSGQAGRRRAARRERWEQPSRRSTPRARILTDAASQCRRRFRDGGEGGR